MAIKIEAATRLNAAKATAEDTIAYLESLGFKGVVVKSLGEDLTRATYTSYNKPTLEKQMGKPLPAKGDSIRYKHAGKGVIGIWPKEKTIRMRNSTAK
jgi:hypothetical protein